jgi:Mur ligase family, catalytic domain
MASTFGFSSMGHFFAAAFHDLQKALLFVDQMGTKVQGAEAKIESLTALLPNGAKAVEVERAAFSALGVLLSAVTATNAAVNADGLNIKLDAAMVTALRALVTDVKSELSALGYHI